jgi:type III restriction enzyme
VLQPNDLDSYYDSRQLVPGDMLEDINRPKIVITNYHAFKLRERPDAGDEQDLIGDDKKEAEKNNEAARLWISGLEIVKRQLGISRVIDLSATPFFLSGSGYTEGTLFPWTMSDFSLMDAIECGIVKLPRVPVADNIPGGDVPMYCNLWHHIRTKMPKKGRARDHLLITSVEPASEFLEDLSHTD